METFYEVIVNTGGRWDSFSLIYVLNLSLFQTLSVCNEGGGGELGRRVRFRQVTADKEGRQWNACQKDRDGGEWGMGQMKTRWASFGATFACFKSNVI